MRRAFFFFILLLLWAMPLGTLCHGQELSLPDLPVPEGLTQYLGEPDSDAENLAGWLDGKKVFDFAKESFSASLSLTLELFFSLLSVTALTAVIEALSKGVENKGIALSVGYLSVLCGASALLETLRDLVELTTNHLHSLGTFASGVIPVYVGICTASGMGGLGATSGTGLALCASFAALLAEKVLLPLLCICFLLDFCSSVSGLNGILAVSMAVRRFFVGMVGCAGALLTAIFAFQTRIAAKADTLAGRTVRYVTQTALPFVGAALSEASRTLAASFSLMGGVVGGVGIVAVVFLMLPVLLQLWLFRLCLLSAGGMAQILSCQRLASLYRDSAALVGALMAATALVDAVLIFEFALIFSI